MTPILSVDNLTIAYNVGGTWNNAVRGVSLHIGKGEIYGLAGESGSGKTSLALAIMRYLANNGRVESGHIFFEGDDLLKRPLAQMRHIWGAKMALVPQNPGNALNPAIRIGEQLAEISQRHRGSTHEAGWRHGADILRDVQIADPERVVDRYPHQLSGGMQQRVLIAMALMTQPELLILDEPTTNLDVTTEAAVLDLLSGLIRTVDAATLYVTHNLGVIAQVCNRVAVMYAGEIVEDASVYDLFRQPLHPYTLGLLNAIPRLDRPRKRLQSIKGSVYTNYKTPAGCIFADRCPFVLEKCRHVKPPLELAAQDHKVSCHRWREISEGSLHLPEAISLPYTKMDRQASPVESVLRLQKVFKNYSVGGFLARLVKRNQPHLIRAVDDVSLSVERGQIIGLVGESGSGKTTLARCIVGLIRRDAGEIDLLNVTLAPEVSQRSRQTLKQLQMVFQNPEESFNPYQSIGEILRRPLMTLLKLTRAEADTRVAALLRAVQLPGEYARRLPSELSGGEKQRVAIARAFASTPDVVVLDEAVSALDVSVQAAILNLLAELNRLEHASYLFISHDLAVVGYLADYIAVMYLGQLMDFVPRESLLTAPVHPYTEVLLSAVPIPDPTHPRERIRLESEIPSPVNLPSGCRFHTRCPRKWGPICEQETPPWQNIGEGHQIRCHYPIDELASLQRDSLAVWGNEK
jgi:peptide/nickel transport system ATP-binding protein